MTVHSSTRLGRHNSFGESLQNSTVKENSYQRCMPNTGSDLSLVISHLDFSNALYIGLPNKNINTLQRMQNMAAKTVLNFKRLDSASGALKELHWLPVKYTIQFKILCLTYKCVHGDAPAYPCDMLKMQTETIFTDR